MLLRYLLEVEPNQPAAVGLELVGRHAQAEIVEQQELQLEVVELVDGQTADLVYIDLSVKCRRREGR